MTRTNELKKLIQTKLKTVCDNVYHETAIEGALFPHIVFSLSSVNMLYLSRQDYKLIIDVWDKGNSTVDVERIADEIQNLFNDFNLPQTTILPTFFVDSQRTVLDDDKTIRHKQITVTIQNYERDE